MWWTFARALAADLSFEPVADGVDVARVEGWVILRVDASRASFSVHANDAEPVVPEGFLDSIHATAFSATTAGYLRRPTSVVGKPSPTAGAYFVAQPRRRGLAPARLLDVACDPIDAILPDYALVVQAERVRTCGGAVLWQNDTQTVSQSLLGTDRQGRVLLINAAAPIRTVDLAERVLALPLDVNRLMILERGAELGLVLPLPEVRGWRRELPLPPYDPSETAETTVAPPGFVEANWLLVVSAVPLSVRQLLAPEAWLAAIQGADARGVHRAPAPGIEVLRRYAEGAWGIEMPSDPYGGTWLALRGADDRWVLVDPLIEVGEAYEYSDLEVQPIPGAPGWYVLSESSGFGNTAGGSSHTSFRVVRAAARPGSVTRGVTVALESPGLTHGVTAYAESIWTHGAVPVVSERSVTVALVGCRDDVPSEPPVDPKAGTWVVEGDRLRKTNAPVVYRGCDTRVE
ncbi:MAG: hypothetical protein ABMA64_28155 [Myxococcota bacterium]